MKLLKKIYELLLKDHSFLKNIFILVIITRLIFLEENQMALLAEILGSIIVLVINKTENNLED